MVRESEPTMQDRYRKRYRLAAASTRARGQIALEAARRLVAAGRDNDKMDDEPRPSDYYAAKLAAAAVLGQRVRPGDLPSDSEVRQHMLELKKDGEVESETPLEPAPTTPAASLAQYLDRFAVYKLRLEPLEAVKQNPKYHPEGDALYHSLQVFHLARDARPYDEEFLLAALLHDVGKAIDPRNHVDAGVEALRGSVTERTLWLIEHHMDLLQGKDKPLSPRLKQELEASEYFEDLVLLRELDDQGRAPGVAVDALGEVLQYLKGLDEESYLGE